MASMEALKRYHRRHAGNKKPAPAFSKNGPSPLLAVFIKRPQAVKSAQMNNT